MSVANNDILRVTAKFDHAGNELNNVYHVRYVGTGDSDGDVSTEILDWLDDAYTDYADVMTQVTDFTSIDIRNLTQDTDLGDFAWPTLVDGNATGDSMPLPASPLVLFNTDTTGSQGRKYMPLITELNHLGLGDLSGDVLADLAAYALELLTDRVLTNGTLEMGNWNDTLSRFAPWVEAIVKAWMGTQRRRNKGVGA
jgi:hypothetical protein